MRNSDNTTWRIVFQEAFKKTGDNFIDLEIAIEPDGLDKEFYSGFGSNDGPSFTAWSANYVYFPVNYDGAEWVGFVARNPNGVATEHIGGG